MDINYEADDDDGEPNGIFSIKKLRKNIILAKQQQQQNKTGTFEACCFCFITVFLLFFLFFARRFGG